MKKLFYISMLLLTCPVMVTALEPVELFALAASLLSGNDKLTFVPFLVPTWQHIPASAQPTLQTSFKTSFAAGNLSKADVQALIQDSLQACQEAGGLRPPTQEEIADLFKAVGGLHEDTLYKPNLGEVKKIIAAAKSKHVDISQLVNARADLGATPLIKVVHRAALVPTTDVVAIMKELLDNHARVNDKDDVGWTALKYTTILMATDPARGKAMQDILLLYNAE